MIRGLWDLQVEATIEVKLGDTDADLYKYKPIEALLARWETIKKDKHSKKCHYQQKLFLPFSLSVDVMLGREILIVLLQLS